MIGRYKAGETVIADLRSPAVHTTVGGFYPGVHTKTRLKLIKFVDTHKGIWLAENEDGESVRVFEGDFIEKIEL